MNDISNTRRAVSIVLFALGSLFLAACYVFYANSRVTTGLRFHRQYDSTQLLYAFVCGVVGLLLWAFGYEPYLKRRDEELAAGIVPDDDLYWETREFPGPHV